MVETVPSGAWTTSELDALIDTYLNMLRHELAGEKYNKRQSNIRLQDQINRTHASIEFKLCNLSAVLSESGRSYIQGYKPRSHYQTALYDRVVHRLAEFPEGADDQATPEPMRFDHSITALNDHSTYDEWHSSVALDHKPTVESLNLQGENDAPEMDRVHVNGSSTPNDVIGALEELWDRSTGGGDVAYRPSEADRKKLPVAPRPAGVEAACKWFASGLATSNLPRYLFLAGGPGAGKSDAAGQLFEEFDKVGPPENGLAHRVYNYAVGTRKAVLINDATIPSDIYEKYPLVNELNQSISGGDHVVACVNRGILVEESKGFIDKDLWDLTSGEAVVKWISGSSEVSQESQPWMVDQILSHDYVRTGFLKQYDQIVAQIVVVYVDVCSLLERVPDTVIDFLDRNVVSKKSKYSIMDYQERYKLDLNTIPAGNLLSQVMNHVSKANKLDFKSEFNPILANIDSLSNPHLQSTILSQLRAAEIVSGQRFTYREIWGAIVRILVGGMPETIGKDEIEAVFHTFEQTIDDPLDQFRHMQQLADMRFSQALFGIQAEQVGQVGEQRRSPVTRMTSRVDPMRDALTGDRADQQGWGWATPVDEAFSGISALGTPLQTLIELLGTEDKFNLAVTEFDRQLDESFGKLMTHGISNDQIRFGVVSWYGAYLGRLYACAHGISGFQQEVSLWIETWCLTPGLPKLVEQGLRTILRPKREPGHAASSSLIPVFDSRTNPIVGEQNLSKLAIQTGDFKIESHVECENLFIILSEHSTEIARMPLDYALIREAVSSTNDHPGMTELTEVTSPRLERFRAARLIPRQLNTVDYRIVQGVEELLLTVSEGD